MLSRLVALCCVFFASVPPAVFADGPAILAVTSDEGVSASKLNSRLKAADVILLGELHGRPEHHRLQAEIVRELIAAGRTPTLQFEMLSERDEALYERFKRTWPADRVHYEPERMAALQEALSWEARGWPAWDAYAELFQLADRYDLPIRHGNLSAKLMRNVRQFGLLALPKRLRTRLFDHWRPTEFEVLVERLRSSVAVSHVTESSSNIASLSLAQMARDAYMALVASDSPRPVVLIVGREHAHRQRGVPFHLKLRAPELEVVAIAFSDGIGDVKGLSGVDDIGYDFVWRIGAGPHAVVLPAD